MTYTDKISEIEQSNLEELKKRIEKKEEEYKNIRDNNLAYIKKQNIMLSIKEKISKKEKHINEINSIKNEIKELNNELSLINDEIKKLKDIQEKLLSIQKTFELERDNEKQIEIEIAQLTSERKNLTNLVNGLLEEINKKLKIKEKIQYYQEIHNWLENYFMKLMINIEKHVMYSIYNEFNSILKEWFSILIEDIEISLDENFSLKIFCFKLF